MKKLLILSDNHGLEEPLKLARKNFSAQVDYFIHCGDNTLPMHSLDGFIAVPGNMDFAALYPSMTQILETEGHRILIEHGHKTISSGSPHPNYALIAADGKRNDCDVVVFGHTHRYLDTVIDGIRLLNPGSCNPSRVKEPDYATMMLVTIDADRIVSEMIKSASLS